MSATPGPWRAGLGSVWTTPGEQLVCAEVSCPDDAALIASAPEQQEKIDALADALATVRRWHPKCAAVGERDTRCDSCRQADAALRLAGRPA